MSRAQLLRSMSSQELTDWMALYKLRHEEHEQAEKEAAVQRSMKAGHRGY